MRQILVAVLLTAGMGAPAWGKPEGPQARSTGAPGDRVAACATAMCHGTEFADGPINVHGGSVIANFSEGSVYIPGQPVTITVKVDDPEHTWAGFQMTARRESDLINGVAGSFSPDFTQGEGVFCEDNSARFPSPQCPPFAPMEFISHTTPSQGDWTFTWMPPENITEPVHFYVAGNAVNNDMEGSLQDHVYTNHYVLTPASTCVAEAPQITGAIVAGAFGAQETISPGNWVEIFGTNFSANPFKEWSGADFQDAVARTSLDRVGVTINGKDAFVRFVSPGQVNVLSPDDNVTGPVELRVTNCEAESPPFVVQTAALSPGVLTQSIDEVIYVRGFDAITFAPLGSPDQPATGGDILTMYGIGFGPTDPHVPAGSITTQFNGLVNDLRVVIGGVELSPKEIIYAGQGLNFIGLYQFNLVLPEMPPGDHDIAITVGGVAVGQQIKIRME